MSSVLAFLIESIEGPCVANQLAIKNAKMVDYIKDFMSAFIVKSDYESRGFLS